MEAMRFQGVCVKAADGAALTGRGANGRNPMALWGERGPLRIIIIIIIYAVYSCRAHLFACSHWPIYTHAPLAPVLHGSTVPLDGACHWQCPGAHNHTAKPL
jgi:hypothetical protein